MPTVQLVRKTQGPILKDIARRMRRPLAEGRGEGVVKIMRRGPGSVDAQFKRTATMEGRGVSKWTKTKRFGTRAPTRPTMQDTGAYRAAWLGGTGGVHHVSTDRVSIAVDSNLFPQVVVHQKKSSTKIRTTAKQRFYLGMTYGVWLKRGSIIEIPPRRLAISAQVIARSQRFLTHAIAKGEIPGGFRG